MEIFHQCFQYTAFLFDFIECYFLLQSMQHFLQIMFECLLIPQFFGFDETFTRTITYKYQFQRRIGEQMESIWL